MAARWLGRLPLPCIVARVRKSRTLVLLNLGRGCLDSMGAMAQTGQPCLFALWELGARFVVIKYIGEIEILLYIFSWFARVVKGEDLRSSALQCAWVRTPQPAFFYIFYKFFWPLYILHLCLLIYSASFLT